MSYHWERERLEAALGPTILQFYQARKDRPVFHCSEMTDYVMRRVPCAPCSPQRILQLLREKGKLRYRVTNRSKSEFTFYYPPMEEIFT